MKSTLVFPQLGNIAALLVLALTIGCGSSSNNNQPSPGGSTPGVPSNATFAGNWNVTLNQPDGSAYITFGLNITQNGTMLQGSAITFSGGTAVGTSCFNSSALQITQGTANGNAVAIVIQDQNQAVNTVNLAGNLANGVITGNYGLNTNPKPAIVGAQPKLMVPTQCPATQGTFTMTRQ